MSWALERRAQCWAILDEGGQEVCFIDITGQPDCGSVASRGRSPEELKAIAELIAAAPDMAEAINAR